MSVLRDLKGSSLGELREFVEEFGEKKFRAAQLYSWIYSKAARSFDDMTDISKDFRTVLAGISRISNLQVISKKASSDGTTKFLFELEDGLAIESVLIPSSDKGTMKEKRLTLCVSTQVGCPLDCKFCATGIMGFSRNLRAGEIIDQLIQVQQGSRERITNLVYMGMGEPFLNYENVMKSIEIINDDHGLNIGARHITISTAGYADKIIQMADEKRPVKLALSLHSLNNQKRAKLMPITKKFPVETLIEALEYYYNKVRRRPTFEYILFEGFNDTNEDMKAFAKLSRRIPCKVNLIPFNPIGFMSGAGTGLSLKPSPTARIETFAAALRKAGITVMVRKSSGQDINAACGQLAVTESKLQSNIMEGVS